MLTDTLVSVEDDLKTIHPLLAKSWTVTPDGKTYDFVLRDDVTFCDGKPMTAADVEATFARWMSPETHSSTVANIGPVKSVKAVGKYEVQFVLSEPFSELLLQLAAPYAGIIDMDAVKKLGDGFGVRGFNGTGPFCWASWRPGDELVLTRHPTYHWGPEFYDNKGPALTERIVWKVVPEENTAVAAILSGTSDITNVFPWSAVGKARANKNIGIVQPRAFGWMGFIGMRIARPLMQDIRVRRAIIMAVDQDAIASAFYYGEADPAHFIAAPNTPDYDKSIEPELLKFDPDGANKLLDEAGWVKKSDGFRYKDGKKLAPVLVGQDNTVWRERLEAVQGMLRDVGVDLQLQLWEPTVSYGKIGQDDVDMWSLFASYSSMSDIISKYFPARQHYSSFKNVPDQAEELTRLLGAGRSALTQEERFKNLSKAQHLIVEMALWIPLVHERELIIYNKTKVTGVKPHSLYSAGLYKGLDLKPL
ncbi:ABC transporter substrate-binding protein [Xanthobacter sp. VNH20]|uniref:ABC transporter substrate-binding protein n=1 Tax=Xanthobacter sp. VNH20 TaxID=3156616 RepID=UPI0032B33F39